MYVRTHEIKQAHFECTNFLQSEETGSIYLLRRRKFDKTFLTIFSLFLFSDFVHPENTSFNFTSFCTCHSAGIEREYYCGHEISTTNPDCMTHALYACINGPNKVARVWKYCENSRCGQVGVGKRHTPDCIDLHKGKYFFRGILKSR